MLLTSTPPSPPSTVAARVLAYTGTNRSEVVWLTGIALGAIVLGSWLLVATRRRPSTHV